MARVLSRNLIRASETLTLTLTQKSLPLPSILLSSRRAKSGGPEKAELIEIDLGSEPESESGSGVEIHVGVRRLEDAIHAIIVRRSRPDWLLFVPGSSYWVPPRAMGVVELVGRVSSSSYSSRAAPPLSEEETMSLTSFRGWPSSEFFLDRKISISDRALPHPVKSPRNVVAQSDDEE